MRISDWSSDVCSSDLLTTHRPEHRTDVVHDQLRNFRRREMTAAIMAAFEHQVEHRLQPGTKAGRSVMGEMADPRRRLHQRFEVVRGLPQMPCGFGLETRGGSEAVGQPVDHRGGDQKATEKENV